VLIWGLSIVWFVEGTTRHVTNPGVFSLAGIFTLCATFILMMVIKRSEGDGSRDYLKFLMLFWSLPIVTFLWHSIIT
jgi:hypothetical protein